LLAATLALTVIGPTEAMTAGVTPGITLSEGLKKITAEKAALLIESHDIISLQYPLTEATDLEYDVRDWFTSDISALRRACR